MPLLSTKLTAALGVEHPVILAPMCGFAMASLAGEVARAGGVGLIGIGTSKIFGPDRVRQEYAAATSIANGKGALGFGFLQTFLDGGEADPSFVAAVALRPRCIWLSFGSRASTERLAGYIREHSSETKVVVQVFTVKEAVRATGLADVVVVQGCDAGGHGRQHLGVSLVTLLPQVLASIRAEHPDVVVVGAGGIIDGRGLASVLCLGADGVAMGSRFVVAEESAAADGFKEKILECEDGTTVEKGGTAVSMAWDRVHPMGGSFHLSRYPGRALSDSETFRRYHSGIDESERAEATARYKTSAYGDKAVWCSSSSGLINESGKAYDLVRSMTREAIATLRNPSHYSVLPE